MKQRVIHAMLYGPEVRWDLLAPCREDPEPMAQITRAAERPGPVVPLGGALVLLAG
jgi:hypothetical protein